MKLWIITLLSTTALASPPASGATQLESLTLDQALEMAESLQPQLAEAKVELKRAESLREQALAGLASAMGDAELANSGTLKTEILSRAETVLKGAEARYAAGDISLAEILPVRRDWAAVQLSYLESLRDVMQAWAEVARYAMVP